MIFSNASKIAFIKRVFGESIVSSDGINITVKCVNKKCSSVSKNKLKLAIRVDTDQAHCWVCGYKSSGSLFNVIKQAGTPSDIQEYLEKYALSKKDIARALEENQEKSDLIKLPNDFKLIMENMEDTQCKKAYSYLKKRNLKDSTIWKMCLGISNQEKLSNRVIIPSFDENGDLNFYVARSFDKKFPKYILAEGHKQDIIFNEARIDWTKELTIVEGPFDLFQSNENATCILGSSLNENYLLFWKIIKNKTPVLLGLDNDAKQKEYKIAENLSKYDVKVRLIDTSQIEDIGSITQDDFENLKQNAENWDRMNFIKSKINQLNL